MVAGKGTAYEIHVHLFHLCFSAIHSLMVQVNQITPQSNSIEQSDNYGTGVLVTKTSGNELRQHGSRKDFG